MSASNSAAANRLLAGVVAIAVLATGCLIDFSGYRIKPDAGAQTAGGSGGTETGGAGGGDGGTGGQGGDMGGSAGSTAGSGGGSGSAGAADCGRKSNDAACDECGWSHCCAELQNCVTGTICATYHDCLVQYCTGVAKADLPACAAQHCGQYASDASLTYNAMASCLCFKSCATTCADYFACPYLY